MNVRDKKIVDAASLKVMQLCRALGPIAAVEAFAYRRRGALTQAAEYGDPQAMRALRLAEAVKALKLAWGHLDSASELDGELAESGGDEAKKALADSTTP